MRCWKRKENVEATDNEDHDFATYCLTRLRPQESEVRTGTVERLSSFY